MTEDEFWTALEFRVCHELNGMAEREYRRLWCDGFLPQVYEIEQARPRIRGIAFIGPQSPKPPKRRQRGRRSQKGGGPCDFSLILNRPYATVDEIDWASLLPAHNLTGWLSVEMQRNYVEIEPSAAVPDLEVPKPVT